MFRVEKSEWGIRFSVPILKKGKNTEEGDRELITSAILVLKFFLVFISFFPQSFLFRFRFFAPIVLVSFLCNHFRFYSILVFSF